MSGWLATVPAAPGDRLHFFPHFPFLYEVLKMMALRSVTTAFLLSLTFLLGLAAFSPTARAQDPGPQDELFFTSGTVTGTITQVNYELGQVKSFVVTNVNNVNTLITVGSPEQSITTAVANAASQGRKVDVNYHTTGNPPTLIYDGMTVYY